MKVGEKIEIKSHCRNIGGMLHEPPERCLGCGADLRPKEVVAGSPGPHIHITLPVAGISIYQCTACHSVMGNVHAYANLRRQQMMDEKSSNIIIPFAKDRDEKKIITLN